MRDDTDLRFVGGFIHCCGVWHLVQFFVPDLKGFLSRKGYK
jgi:hypothetical protein